MGNVRAVDEIFGTKETPNHLRVRVRVRARVTLSPFVSEMCKVSLSLGRKK